MYMFCTYPKAKKSTQPDHLTGTIQSVVAVPVNAERQTGKLQPLFTVLDVTSPRIDLVSTGPEADALPSVPFKKDLE